MLADREDTPSTGCTPIACREDRATARVVDQCGVVPRDNDRSLFSSPLSGVDKGVFRYLGSVQASEPGLEGDSI